MASWKKVLVESANISVGTITATLGDNTTDLSASNHASIELVVSESNVLKTRTADFGTAAFSDATDFATAAQGSTADSALQSSDFAAELVTGTAAGKGGIAVTGGTNAIKGGDGDDIQLDLDINSIVTTITSVASSDLIPLEDATDNVTKKATVANILSAAGVTQFNAGRNLTEADGDTTGTIDLDLDVNLVQVNSIKATEGSGSNATGSSLQLHGGAGTGSGAGGGIRLKVADGGSSGSTLNSYATAVQVNDDKTTDFNEKISITAAAGGTAIDAGDFDIVNVNDLKIDRLLAHDNANLEIAFPAVTGGGVISIADNMASALVLKQSGNEYMLFKTSNGAEEVKIGHGVSGTAITIGHSTSETTIGDNLTVTGNLTVNGDTTTVSSSNLLVEDQFIYLNDSGSGTNVNRDGGIVIEGNTKSVAFGYHQSDDRFVFDKTGATSNMTDIDADAFFVHVHTASGAAQANHDTDFAQIGNLYIDSGNEDIYIYS